MAGAGGAQAPDYRPRPPAGPGAAANRQDMTSGKAALPGSAPLTGAPTTPPATGTGGAYGMRSELQGLTQGAPTRASQPSSAMPKGGSRNSSASPAGFADSFEEMPEPVMPPQAPVPIEALAAYSPADLRSLERSMPLLHKLASQPDAGPAVQALFHLAGEIVLHTQAAPQEPVGPIGPDWTDGG